MDKVFTNIEHVAWLREQAAKKRPYWYGTYYLDCTEKLLAKKAKQYPAHYGSDRFARYSEDIKNAQICGDCVNGAIKGAIWSELGKHQPVYKSHNCPDKSADGMFSYCKSIGMDWGAIGTMPDVPGVAVRMAGHVGVYVGNGEVVEWRGFKYGCVVTKLSARKWLHWYKLPWTNYVYEQPTYSKPSLLGARLLKYGCKGEDVEELQTQLNALGYDCGIVDGDFGKNTQKGVKAFQKAESLVVDGKYGDKSHAALMAALAASEDNEDDAGDEVTKFVVVTGSKVNIRKGAGTAFDIITVARKDSKLPYIATASNGWHCVEINGRNGWISGNYSKVEG